MPRRLGVSSLFHYEPDEFIDRVRALEGRRLARIHYYDNTCFRDGYDDEYWDQYGEAGDSIHSVELFLDDGEILAIHCIGVEERGLWGANHSILETEACRIKEVGDVWDVSHHSRWMDVLNVPIAAVRLYCRPACVGAMPEVTVGMMDLALEFTSGHTIYLAGNAQGIANGLAVRSGEDLLVAFGDGAALKLGVGPFAEPAWMDQDNLAPGLAVSSESLPGLAPALGDAGPNPRKNEP